MSDLIFVVEIAGEGAFHKFLVQSGWSGKDYYFQYNAPTNTHMRAYRSIEEYRAERVDMHKSSATWPIMANLLPADQVEAHVFVSPPLASAQKAAPGGNGEQTEGDSEPGDDDDGDDSVDDLAGKRFKTLQVIARDEGVPEVESIRTAKELIEAINAARAARQ